jgi:hypothetical protein
MEEMNMSEQNQEGQNQVEDPFQAIYREPQNLFANLWDTETRQVEFPFLEVTALISNKEASHQLVLQDAGGWRFSIGFHIYGKVVSDLAPNTLCLDVGNRFCKGILDHHQQEKKPDKKAIVRTNSAASLVYRFPHMITEAIEEKKSTSISIYLHKRPDFDAVTAAYLAVYYLVHQRFPGGSRFIADYARMLDEGNTPYLEKFTLAASPSAILYMANTISKKSLLRHRNIIEINDGDFRHILDNLMFLNGLAVLDRIFAEFHRKGLDENDPRVSYHIHRLFSAASSSLFPKQ